MKKRWIILAILAIILYTVFSMPHVSIDMYQPPEKNHKVLTGPNRYASLPVIEVVIDGDARKVCQDAIALSASIGFTPQYATTRGNKLVIHYDDAETTLEIIRAVLRGHPEKEQLASRYQSVKLGPSTRSILAACDRNEIPYRRLNDQSLFQVGYGIHRKMIEASCSSHTTSIAEIIAKDKDLCKQMLEKIGIPVPRGFYVEGKRQLLEKYRQFNGPVVLKPYDGNHGDGVITNIRSEAELIAAYDIVEPINSAMLIEDFITGNDYRVLVVGYKVVAVARRTPPSVVGDGVHTISYLVEQLNRNPKRGKGHSALLSLVEFDDVMTYYLSTKGMSRNTVPASGERVVLRNNGNLSSGGSAEDVTDQIHPETAEDCVMACRQIGLNICGLDIVAESISTSLRKQGAIIEMNSGPGLRMHLSPNSGKGRDVATPILADLFPDGRSRIPLVAITGTNGKTTTVQLVSHILRGVYQTVGKTTTSGVYINDEEIIKGDCSGPSSAISIISNPTVEAAVLEVARGGILRKGLGYDKATVGCITNIGKGDHLGEHYEDSTIDDLIEIKSTVIRNIERNGSVVLNRDDPYYDRLRALTTARVITFSISSSDADVYYDRGRILYRGFRFDLNRFPIMETGMDFQIENVMAAIACSIGCGVEPLLIKNRLESFVNDFRSNPGRMNVIPYGRHRIVLDYAHNEDSIEKIAEYASRHPTHYRIVVYAAPGDRDEQTLRHITRRLSETFDHIIFYVDDATQRGRTPNELFAITTSSIPAEKPHHTIYGEMNAIRLGFEMISQPSLLMVLVDNVENAMQCVDQQIKKNKE